MGVEMAVIWTEVVRPLMVLALVVAAISVVTWHFSRPKPSRDARHQQRCPSCAAGVYHSQHPEGGN